MFGYILESGEAKFLGSWPHFLLNKKVNVQRQTKLAEVKLAEA